MAKLLIGQILLLKKIKVYKMLKITTPTKIDRKSYSKHISSLKNSS